MAWPENVGVDPKVFQLDHMTPPGQPQPEQHLSPFDDSFENVHPSLRYFINFGNPHSNVMGLAGPNLDAQAENFDMQDCISPDNQHHLSESFAANTGNLHGFGQASDYQSTSHVGNQTAISTGWPPQTSNMFSAVGMNSFNEPQNPTTSWGPSSQDSFMGIPSAMNDFTSAKATPLKSKPATKKTQNPSSRARKNRMRLISRRSSSPVQNKHVQATPSQALGASSSNTSSQVDLTPVPKVDLHEAIALLEASFQEFSPFSQLKGADLINQMKQLVLEEQKYGKRSQSGSSRVNATSTAPSTQDTVSNSEMVDSEYRSDNTSVSSTPRQPLKDNEDTDDSMSIGETRTEVKHKPCEQCGVKALLQCTWKNCGYSTHSFADYKRHESGEKHWPQERFMCLECIDHSTPALDIGHGCSFCHIPFSAVGGNIPVNYLRSRLRCQSARREITTFIRKDHLINHLREHHNMINMNTTIDTWKYGIDSNWPKHCGFCGINFSSWNARMNHLKDHFVKYFEDGEDVPKYRFPFPKSMDFRPSGPTLPKDDDDDDQDDNFGGNGGGSWAKTTGKQNSQNATQTWGNSSGSSKPRKSSTHTRYRKAHNSENKSPALDVDTYSIENKETSIPLQRYLNDTDEPIAARLNFGNSETAKVLLGSVEKEAVICSEIPISPSDLHASHSEGICDEHELRKHIDKAHRARVKLEPDASLHGVQQLSEDSVLKPGDAIPPQELDAEPHCYELPASENFATELDQSHHGISVSEPVGFGGNEDCSRELPSIIIPSSSTSKDTCSLQNDASSVQIRPFACLFDVAGCTSTFATKNEWKRHVKGQHLSSQDPVAKTTGGCGVDSTNLGTNPEYLNPGLTHFTSPTALSATTKYSPVPFSMGESPLSSFDSPITEWDTDQLQSSSPFVSPPANALQSHNIVEYQHEQRNYFGCADIDEVQALGERYLRHPQPQHSRFLFDDEPPMYTAPIDCGSSLSSISRSPRSTGHGSQSPLLQISYPCQLSRRPIVQSQTSSEFGKTSDEYDIDDTFSISGQPSLPCIEDYDTISLQLTDFSSSFTGSDVTNVGKSQVQSQKMKKRRRRESNNAVERQQRNNINERIQDLSRLVPANRLEDEKTRNQTIVSTAPPRKDYARSSTTPRNSDDELNASQCQGLPPLVSLANFLANVPEKRSVSAEQQVCSGTTRMFMLLHQNVKSSPAATHPSSDIDMMNPSHERTTTAIMFESTTEKTLKLQERNASLIAGRRKNLGSRLARCTMCTGGPKVRSIRFPSNGQASFQGRDAFKRCAEPIHERQPFDWRKADRGAYSSGQAAKSDSAFFLCDAGGGTVDLASYRIEETHGRDFLETVSGMTLDTAFSTLSQHTTSQNLHKSARVQIWSSPTLQQKGSTSDLGSVYPIPIQPEKRARAMKLYEQYLFAKKEVFLSASITSRHSRSSSNKDQSYLPSNTGCATDFLLSNAFEGISFDEEIDERQSAEPTSFRPPTLRTRKRLSPEARASAALVRYLGSCSTCRDRRVRCPLEHHDIASLIDHVSSEKASAFTKIGELPSNTQLFGRNQEFKMGNLSLENMIVITFGLSGVGMTSFVSEYFSKRSHDSMFWYSTENYPRHGIPGLLSPEDLIQHLDNEAEDRLHRVPPLNWSVLIRSHGDSRFGDHLDATDLRTLTDAAFQRYLENVKASTLAHIGAMLGSDMGKGIVKEIFLVGGFGDSFYLMEQLQSGTRTPYIPSAWTNCNRPDFWIGESLQKLRRFTSREYYESYRSSVVCQNSAHTRGYNTQGQLSQDHQSIRKFSIETGTGKTITIDLKDSIDNVKSKIQDNLQLWIRNRIAMLHSGLTKCDVSLVSNSRVSALCILMERFEY
ncbi:hypothetical protein IFR05_013709 [Cadophora sp. M221]|nr:hypothetical protein IFR05_013709 [Cadophora sp. M221]